MKSISNPGRDTIYRISTEWPNLRKFLGLCLCVAVGLLLFSACAGSEVTGVAMRTGPRAWLDQPPGDVSVPLGPYTLKAHANAETDRVRAIRFVVNDIPLNTVGTDTEADLAYAEFDWNPSVPGEYVVQAIAVAVSGAEGEPAMAQVCVETTEGGGCPKMADEISEAQAAESPTAEIEPTLTSTPAVGGFTGGGIGVIEGTVLSDLTEDGDGVDAGEGPLQGMTVSVAGCASESMVTGPDGTFGFKVPSGACRLQVEGGDWFFISAQPSGTTYPVPVNVATNASSQVTIYMYNKKVADEVAAGGVPGGGIGVIEGKVLADLTEDGDAYDASEGPLQGVTVSVSGCASDSMVTGSDGAYGFKVPAGDCQLQATGGDWFFISAQPSGATYPVPVSVALNASSWVTIYMYNKEAAGLAAVTPTTGGGIGVIEGTVLADLNEDGDANDTGEGPLQGMTVSVGGCASESMVTGPDGAYGFKVPSGACQLQVNGGEWFFISAQPSGVAYPVPVPVAPNASSWVTIFMYNKKAAIDVGASQQPAPTWTPTTPPQAIPQAPTDTPTPTPPSPGKTSIDFWADAGQVNYGDCTTIHWAVEGVQAVYLEYGGSSQGVTGNESRKVCPSSDGEFYRLRVILSGGGQETRDLTIGVVGSPPPKQPPEQQLPEQQPPQKDTTPPEVSSVSIGTKTVYYGSCGGMYPTSFDVTATVGDDPSGISQVMLWYTYTGSWMTAAMYSKGGNTWVASQDISQDAYSALGGGNGQISIRVSATDGAGNTGERDGSPISVEFCPG